MLEELRRFLLVADHGTFTAAAQVAHVSQPALTASIRRLEDEVGARVLHRGAGGTRLSAAGEALLPRARAAVAAFDEGRRAVAELEGLRAGEVRIGAGATVCTFYLPPRLTDFRRRHPAIVLKLREMTSDAAIEALAAGELDLAMVMPTGESGAAAVPPDPWLEDELIWVGPAKTLLDAVPPRAPTVTFPRGASTRELLDRHFPGAPVVMELSGISAVLAFVEVGTGVALVSRAAVTQHLARGVLREIPTPRTPLRRPIDIWHRGVDRLPPAAAALRKHLLGGQLPRGTRRPPSRKKPSR